jgi:hypothetical protein
MVKTKRLVAWSGLALALLLTLFSVSSILVPPRVQEQAPSKREGGFLVFDENLTLSFVDFTGHHPEEFIGHSDGSFTAMKDYNIEAGPSSEQLDAFTKMRYGTGSGAFIFSFRIKFSLVRNGSDVFSVEDDMTGPRSSEAGPTIQFFNELQYSLCLNGSGLYANTTNLATRNDQPWTDGKFTNTSTRLIPGNYTFIARLQSVYVPSSFSFVTHHYAFFETYSTFTVEYAPTATFDYLVVTAAASSFVAGSLVVYISLRRLVNAGHVTKRRPESSRPAVAECYDVYLSSFRNLF